MYLLNLIVQSNFLSADSGSFALLVGTAIIPIILLIVLLGFLKMPGHTSALITLVTSVLLALLVFHFPLTEVGLAVVYGILKAVFPILIIIAMAIFSYNVLVHTGKMEIIKEQFSSISSDKCVQVLLLTWGFGGLLEGMAGFGTAVAIPAAILISLGFNPIFSAVASLIANSVATAFGAVGTPVVTLAGQIGVNDVVGIQTLSMNVVWQLSALMILVPFVLTFMTDPRLKALPKNIFLSVLVGLSSLSAQYLSARYMGAETPAIIGSLVAIVVIIAYAKIAERNAQKIPSTYTVSEIFSAWSVYGLILLLVVLTSPLLPFKAMLESFVSTTLKMNIYDSVSASNQIRSVKISLMDAGALLFIGSMLGGLIQGAKLKDLFRVLWTVIKAQKKTIITVCCLIALSSVMDFSGMIFVLGAALAKFTGSLYPLFAPTIGCLGTFLTGSDTSSNILFGKLQATVAQEIGVDKSWLAAANTAGATGGKIISPQSIVVATSAIGQQGKEGEIMKKALPYALGYILIAGLVVYFGLFLFY